MQGRREGHCNTREIKTYPVSDHVSPVLHAGGLVGISAHRHTIHPRHPTGEGIQHSVEATVGDLPHCYESLITSCQTLLEEGDTHMHTHTHTHTTESHR